MHKDIVLLTSASGYIGGRLLRALEKGGRSAVHATAVLILCAGALIPETGHAQPNTPVRTVPSVDLERYVGEWFEIGRFPNRFQRRCVGDVTARYARRSDGTLDVINRCRTDGESIAARGVARVVDDTGARLKVRFAPAALSFLPFVWGDYWILGLAGDYSWAVVGSPDREYLWVLARTPTLGEDAFGQAMAVARANGFNVDRLERTAQGAAQGGLDVSGNHDAPAIDRELARLAAVLRPLELLQNAVMPALVQVGDDWHRNRARIAQDHLMSSTVRNILGSFLRVYARPNVPARLLFATPAGERHELGTLGAAMLAASSGLGVAYLGPDVPADDLLESVKAAGAQVMVLGLTRMSGGKATEQELRAIVRDLPPDVELWAGGHTAGRYASIITPRGRIFGDYTAYQRELVRLGGHIA